MFCSEWALVKVTFKSAHVLPLKCKCWTCDECRPGRTRRVVEEAKSGNPTFFITLTHRRRPGLTPSEAAEELVVAWRKIRRSYEKKHGKGSVAFMAVFEATKKGWPHIHIVARCKSFKEMWLRKKMRKLLNSPVVCVRRIHGKSKIAAYVTKYIGKNPHRFKGTKRYWRSLDYLLPPADEPYDEWDDIPYWHVEQRFWLFVAQDLHDAGYTVKAPWDQAPTYLKEPSQWQARCPP